MYTLFKSIFKFRNIINYRFMLWDVSLLKAQALDTAAYKSVTV